jgi:hypothetical protein
MNHVRLKLDHGRCVHTRLLHSCRLFHLPVLFCQPSGNWGSGNQDAQQGKQAERIKQQTTKVITSGSNSVTSAQLQGLSPTRFHLLQIQWYMQNQDYRYSDTCKLKTTDTVIPVKSGCTSEAGRKKKTHNQSHYIGLELRDLSPIRLHLLQIQSNLWNDTFQTCHTYRSTCEIRTPFRHTTYTDQPVK